LSRPLYLQTVAVHVVFGFDDKYAEGAGVAISSLGLNAPDDEYEVHLLADAVSQESRRRVEASAAPNIRLTWYDAAVDDVREVAWVSRATYLRLVAPDYLPSDLGRAIYLDADVFIRGSLAPVAEMDLHGHPLGAPRNTSTPFVAWPGGLHHYREHGFDPRAPYLAAGMLVYDLAMWRDERLSKVVLAHCQATKATDQSGLNVCFYGRWAEMPLYWHQQPDVFDPTSWAPRILDGIEKARQDPLVVTFGGALKPWHAGGDTHPLFTEWKRARDASGWADIPLPVMTARMKTRRRLSRAWQVLRSGTYRSETPTW
jgi:lipopolysaccharide biosynthesis glycosyltransferase